MTRPSMDQKSSCTKSVYTKGGAEVKAVVAQATAARCSTPGCGHHAQDNHRHCKNCFVTWKTRRDTKRAALKIQNTAESAAAPMGVCSNSTCRESTYNGHKFCSTCYVSWRKTRGHCKWRKSNGQLCGVPVAGGNPFCHECYTQHYLPCVSTTHPTAMTQEKVVHKADTAKTSKAPLNSSLLVNAPTFTPWAMKTATETEKVVPVVDVENFRAAIKAIAPRVASRLPGLVSPGTKAAQFVAHTWMRVNANAARSVIRRAAPAWDELDTITEAAVAPTWAFSVFPGHLGHAKSLPDLPDPGNDKMMRLMRNSWKSPSPLVVGPCA